MERLRSFIAIELPDEFKLELSQLEARLKSDKQHWVKWVDPDNIHLTLKFLGNAAIDASGEITGAMEEAAQGIPPFHLAVKDLGVFPNWKQVRVAWVGISGEIDRLSQLHRRIDSNLAPLGFTPESRPFTPHLTLARLHNQASSYERRRFGQLIADTKFKPNSSIKVDLISLMRSKLTREGAIYSRISVIGLNKSYL
ncbi:RNA 2',3'-cyclic phosphodiesterase [Chloroflexota bacterium]